MQIYLPQHINIYDKLPDNVFKIPTAWNITVQNIWRYLVNKTRVKIPVEKINLELFNKLNIKKKKYYKYAAIHGDFTPWNIKIQDEKDVWVYDWESFSLSAPYLTDPIYYIIQVEKLIKNSNISKISKILVKAISTLDKSATLDDLFLALAYLYHNSRNDKYYYNLYEYMIKNI